MWTFNCCLIYTGGMSRLEFRQIGGDMSDKTFIVVLNTTSGHRPKDPEL